MRSMFAILMMTTAVAMVAAAPDPLVTPRAELAARQADPALLGWVDAINGQFSDQRSCDYPATLSSSASLAQCCSGSSCTFWSRCSAGTLFAAQTSQFCDQGYCNTAVIVPTVGASTGVSYLGCWATSLGQDAFTIIRNIGSAPVVAPTSTSSAHSGSNTSGASSKPTSTGSAAVASGGSGSATQSSAGAAKSSGATVANAVKPLTSVLGSIAVLFGIL